MASASLSLYRISVTRELKDFTGQHTGVNREPIILVGDSMEDFKSNLFSAIAPFIQRGAVFEAEGTPQEAIRQDWHAFLQQCREPPSNLSLRQTQNVNVIRGNF